MSKPATNKRRVREKRLNPPIEGIELDVLSTKFKKEEKEQKQRAQEATRESD